jgi:hypothetical protein
MLRRVGCWSTNIPASKQARFSFLGTESDFRPDEMYIFSFVCVGLLFVLMMNEGGGGGVEGWIW